jgi:hypothetical protein
MSSQFPLYRVSQWIDTSPEAMDQEQATIVFGVQTKREQGGKWMHVAKDGKALFFDSAEKASEAIKELRNAKAERAAP